MLGEVCENVRIKRTGDPKKKKKTNKKIKTAQNKKQKSTKHEIVKKL